MSGGGKKIHVLLPAAHTPLPLPPPPPRPPSPLIKKKEDKLRHEMEKAKAEYKQYAERLKNFLRDSHKHGVQDDGVGEIYKMFLNYKLDKERSEINLAQKESEYKDYMQSKVNLPPPPPPNASGIRTKKRKRKQKSKKGKFKKERKSKKKGKSKKKRKSKKKKKLVIKNDVRVQSKRKS